MPDYPTIALRGVVSLIVRWSTVGIRLWWERREEKEEWFRGTDSLVSLLRDRMNSIKKGRKFHDPATLGRLVEEGEFDTIDEWIQELNVKLTGSPENLDAQLYSMGNSVVLNYETYRYGGDEKEAFRQIEQFQEYLSYFRRMLRDVRGPKVTADSMF